MMIVMFHHKFSHFVMNLIKSYAACFGKQKEKKVKLKTTELLTSKTYKPEVKPFL